MDLRLTTPEQHDFQDPTLELDENKLQRWLTGLPVLNAGESLRLVLNALEPLNEQHLDVDKRLSLLSVYQATFDRLYATAEPVRLRQQPLSRQQRQDTVDDVERLSLGMANGFKLAVKSLYAQGDAVDEAKFARALRSTMKALAATLLHSYRFYRPEPDRVFQELNQIYRLARHRGLIGAVDADDPDTAQVSLAGMYQAIALLALCDPFSLEEGRADTCYRALQQYAGGVRIVPGNSWQGVPEGLFFVDLMSDSRPRHCVFLESPVAGDDPHIMDARTALQTMHKALAALPADRRRQRVEAVILRNLLPEVSARDKRRSQRRRDGRRVGLVAGLAAIVDWLHARQRGEAGEVAEWRVRDASEGGYCLAWDASAASLLQVGDPVCIMSDADGDSGQTLQLMVVRWLRDVRGQGAELGVELVAGVPGPVEIQPVDSKAQGRMPALFLPSQGGTGARLMTPAQVYAENRVLLIYAGEREVTIRCGGLVEQAPGFDCFEFASS